MAQLPARCPPARCDVARSSVVQADESVQPLIAALLGRTCIVADLPTATAAWRETNGEFRFRHARRRAAEPPRHLHRRLRQRQRQRQGAVLDSRPQEPDRRTAGAPCGNCRSRSPKPAAAKARCKASRPNCRRACSRRRPNCAPQEVAIATHEGEFNALQNSLRALAPENRHGRLRNPEPRRAGAGRQRQARRARRRRSANSKQRETALPGAGRATSTPASMNCASNATPPTPR